MNIIWPYLRESSLLYITQFILFGKTICNEVQLIHQLEQQENLIDLASSTLHQSTSRSEA